jgi:hypothetical protein
MSLYATFVALMAPFEVYTPKVHIMWHLLKNQLHHGNPVFYSNWVDEALNKTLKSACRMVSQSTFESSVLLKMRTLLERSRKRHAD